MIDKDVKKNIKDLLEGIDEFDNKYITYRAQTLRTILTETLMYIEQKEQECEKLASANKRLGADLCGQLQNHMRALDEIENIADDYNRVEKTSQYYRDGFDQIQDIINSIKEQ